MPLPTAWRYYDSRSGLAYETVGEAAEAAIAGTGSLTLNSLVTDENGEAVGSKSTGVSYRKYQVVLVEGATPSWFNGLHRITAVTATTFRYIPAGAEPSTSASGTLLSKVAPLPGWSVAFSDATAVAITNGRWFIRLPKSEGLQAIKIYSSMTGLNAGVLKMDYGAYTNTPRVMGAYSGRAEPKSLLVGDENTLIVGCNGFSTEYNVNLAAYLGNIEDFADPNGDRVAVTGFLSPDATINSAEYHLFRHTPPGSTLTYPVGYINQGVNAAALGFLSYGGISPTADLSGLDSVTGDTSPLLPVLVFEVGGVRRLTGRLRGLATVLQNTPYSTNSVEYVQTLTYGDFVQAYRMCRTYNSIGAATYGLRIM